MHTCKTLLIKSKAAKLVHHTSHFFNWQCKMPRSSQPPRKPHAGVRPCPNLCLCLSIYLPFYLPICHNSTTFHPSFCTFTRSHLKRRYRPSFIQHPLGNPSSTPIHKKEYIRRKQFLYHHWQTRLTNPHCIQSGLESRSRSLYPPISYLTTTYIHIPCSPISTTLHTPHADMECPLFLALCLVLTRIYPCQLDRTTKVQRKG